MAIWLGIWRTLVQLFYIVVVILILSSLHGRLELLVVSLFGLVYTLTRSIAIGQMMSFSAFCAALQKELNTLRAAVDQEYFHDPSTDAEAHERIRETNKKFWFELGGIGIIAPICLIGVFVSLSRS